MTVIEVEDLYKCYWVGNVPFSALNGVCLRIEAGAFAVLSGRSGSGKTTLLNVIGGLDVADRGSVRISGEDMLHKSADQRAAFRLHHVGFVFQAYNLVRVLSARENVAYPCQLRGINRGECLIRADRWLARVGLQELVDRRPDQLSGGQQQRVAVARALAGEPDMVLADEPTANLDTNTGAELIALMKRLNRELQMTFLISSHDPAVIEQASPLIRLEDGRVVDGTAAPVSPPLPPAAVCPSASESAGRRLHRLLTELARRRRD